jgi:hypothetical protein
MDREHDQFVACFHAGVCIYNEPELSARPAIRTRAQLRSWLEHKSPQLREVSVRLVGVSEAGPDCCVTETVIVGGGDMPEAWRLVLAVLLQDELIKEVRAFRDREAAFDWVTRIW